MKRFFAALFVITSASLLYVYHEVEVVKVGYVIRKQEETKTLFLDRARSLKYNIARLTAPSNLERRLSAQRIVLQSPKSWQTLVMSKPVSGQSKMADLLAARPPFFGKLMVGTAQAEAKEN